ncbi:MAG: hypothetical protein ACFE7R_09715, partial [Candidatus Hodarchaeota archaeon]
MEVIREVIIVFVFYLTVVPIIVVAANTQGLVWGVEVEDRFDFEFTYENDTESIDVRFYVIITGLPEI